MNTKAIKNLYEDVRYLTCMDWEQFQQRSQFSPEDSYEVCKDKLTSVLCHLPEDDTRAWRYFQTVYEDIPVQYRLPLFFECVYRSFSVDYPSVLVMIADYLNRLETPMLKAERIKAARERFESGVMQDGKITLYRCVKEGCLLPRSAVRFTANRTDAERALDEGEEFFGVVYCCEIDVADVLYCDADGNVFVVPDDVKNGIYGFNDDLGLLNLDTLKEDFPDEYDELSTLSCFDELCDYPFTYRFIFPDLSLTEVSAEASEAKNAGDIRLYDQLVKKQFKKRERAHQKKMHDEYTRYLKARQGK